jgi:hypothetical protein
LAIASLTIAVMALGAWLYIGIDARLLRLGIFVLTAALAAILVVLVPAAVRGRLGLLVSTFVTAVGLLPLLMQNESGGPAAGNAPAADPTPNIDYAVRLMSDGPFTERLPGPMQLQSISLLAGGAVDDPNAAGAIELDLDMPDWLDPFEGYEGPTAWLEVYRTEEEAAARAKARYQLLRTQYAEFGPITGDETGFYQFGNGEILSGGVSGHSYCEGTMSPDSNANVPFATGLVSSCLRYAERMLRLSAN